MSSKNKWLDIESAPRDGTNVLLDIGFPWPVIGFFDEIHSNWVYSQLQCSNFDGDCDFYFETEWQKIDPKFWMPLPEILNEKN